MAKHTITYRRPESPGSLVRQTTPTTHEAVTQVERLAALGYLLVDVEPKLTGLTDVAVGGTTGSADAAPAH